MDRRSEPADLRFEIVSERNLLVVLFSSNSETFGILLGCTLLREHVSGLAGKDRTHLGTSILVPQSRNHLL